MRKAVLQGVYELAKRDPRVVFIGSDIGVGTLDQFKKEMPDRFFMEGIYEQALTGMAAGLALTGKIVYINTIATFITRRSFEQNMIDLGLHGAKVRLIGSGGGVVYAPLGPTHLALEDIAIMRTIPHMSIVAPCDADEMERLMPQTLDYPGPMYIRVAKGGDPIVSKPTQKFVLGKAIQMSQGTDILLITTGITLQIALEARTVIEKTGRSVAILHVHTLKPLDEKKILSMISAVRVVVTIEEHSIIGGLGSMVAELIAEHRVSPELQFKRIAFPDEYVHGYGSQQDQLTSHGISVQGVIREVNKLL